MFLVLIALIAWPLAEIYVAVRIAEAIGVLAMFLLLIVSWPLGTWALRLEGRAAWRRLADAVALGRDPGREALSGFLILAGGVLMIVPGFITDGLGLLLLAPPTRALMRRLLVRNLRSRLVVRASGFGRGAPSYDVDSTATDVDQPRLRP